MARCVETMSSRSAGHKRRHEMMDNVREKLQKREVAIKMCRTMRMRVRGFRHVVRKEFKDLSNGPPKFYAEKYNNIEGTKDTLREAALLADEGIRARGKPRQAVNFPKEGERALPVELSRAATRAWVYDPLLDACVWDLSEDGLDFVELHMTDITVAVPVYRRDKPRSVNAVPLYVKDANGNDTVTPLHVFLHPFKGASSLRPQVNHHGWYSVEVPRSFPRGNPPPLPEYMYQGDAPDETLRAETWNSRATTYVHFDTGELVTEDNMFTQEKRIKYELEKAFAEMEAEVEDVPDSALEEGEITRADEELMEFVAR